MELEGEDVDDETLDEDIEMVSQDDNEKTQLPDEWIYDLEVKNQSLLAIDTSTRSCSSMQQ
jgi:hypothetical protein